MTLLIPLPFILLNIYRQTIITEVGQQLNQLYSQFKKDYPDFTGDVSVSFNTSHPFHASLIL
jgi:hypothetical protein